MPQLFLRTTVPASIVKQFNLNDGDKLDWSIDIKDGKMVALVRSVR
jgi:bifunctional DNA-binding transcriptional regulator/antitoxin component of YhaV-PrlF toxin-antitoxin module